MPRDSRLSTPRVATPTAGVRLVTAGSAGLVFLLALLSPVQMVESDPAVMLLAAQAVLDHHTLRLDDFRDDPTCAYDLERDYRVFDHGGSLYYHSIAAPILSVPIVWLANLFGLHMLDQTHEFLLQNVVSAGLTALAFILLVQIGRHVAGPWPGYVIALVTTLGTSLVSTLATGLWNSCYQVVLVCLAFLTLVRGGDLDRRSRLVGVAALLGIAFLARPSTAFLIIALAVTIPEIPPRKRVFGFVGVVFLAVILFAVFGTGNGVLKYYSLAKLIPETPLLFGLYGTLLSPSRGLLVFSPFLVIAIATVVWRRREVLDHWVSHTVILWITLHTVAVSTREVWWGGHAFGPRLMTDLMPGLAVLTGLAWQAVFGRFPHPRRTVLAAAYLVLAVPAVFIHSYQGLFNLATKRWNSTPNVDQYRSLLLSWRYPQFMTTDAAVDERLFEFQRDRLDVYRMGDLLAHDSPDLALKGWYETERAWRWSRGNVATLALRLGEVDTSGAYLLELNAGGLGRQRVFVAVNGESVSAFELDGLDPQPRIVVVPGRLLVDGYNRVELDIPDASRTADDARILGVALRSLRLSELTPDVAPVTFREDAFFQRGFSTAEVGRRWTDGPIARLVYPVLAVESGVDYQLELVAGAYGRQRVEIAINGTPLSTIELDGQQPQRKLLTVPALMLRPFQANELDLTLPDARRPATETRRLGLSFVSLAIVRSGGTEH